LSAILQVEIGWLEFRRQHLDESLRLLEDAMAVLERLGADASIMRALDMIWGPLEGLGRGAESLPGLRRALRLAEKLRDVQMETRIRSHLGFRFVIAGTPEEARPHVERSQSLGRMMGDAYSEAIATWAAAEMQLALGDLDAAAEAIETELALFASIGGNPRHEAIAHAQRSHVARLAGDATKAGEEATLARAAAAKAAIGDRAFAQRIEGYLLAPRWVPNSM
jgi:hypothetical protein